MDDIVVRFYSFFGIPYALPPIGHLRFKPPEPSQHWDGIRDATQEKEGCISRNPLTQKLEGGEDCLFLNVFSPMMLSGSKTSKPVMVWIHGGAFQVGSTTTDLYGPEYLLTQDIVLVTVNYRLGALGFSCLEDSTLGVTGNNGLRDILMALKWVKANITGFLGDPENITLFGESSGSVSIHYLMLSPLVKDLFHRVIMHSGCALHHWAEGARNSLRELAKILGLSSGSDKEILEFLQQQPIEVLYDAQLKVKSGISPHIKRHFYPVFEKPSPNITPIITENPAKIIASGNYYKVPMMIGYTSKNFEHMIPHHLNIPHDTPLSRYIANEIKSFYFNDEEPTLTKHKTAFYEVFGDIFFNYGLMATALMHLETLGYPIYYFRFSVDGEFNFYKGNGLPGASHSDDACYLFKVGCRVNEVAENSLEDITIQRMVKLWTNFAKSGNPNSEEFKDINWKPIEPTKLHYLDIGENLSMGVNPEYDMFVFWDKIYKMKVLPGKM
ncbi:Carboxylesterase family [Popillia japonica]|uniref:Carboxylesterase family n=1 Tax=Popillia japonica TaxID=7064 RepID=A0AAW1MK82_POPJA